MTNAFGGASPNEAEAHSERAAERHEEWLDEVQDLYGGGALTYTAARVAHSIAGMFLWDRPTPMGAPMLGTHVDAAGYAGFSRQTLYNGKNELEGAGLITSVGTKWFAIVNDVPEGGARDV